MSLESLPCILAVAVLLGAAYCLHIVANAKEIVQEEENGTVHSYAGFEPGAYTVLSVSEAFDGEAMRVTLLAESAHGIRCVFWTRCHFYRQSPSEAYRLMMTLTQGERISVQKDGEKVRIMRYYG